MKKTAIALMLAGLAGAAFAQATPQTPVGLWKSIDDATGKEKSLVRITETNGVLTGKVEKILEAGKENAKCDKCADEDPRQDQPIQGMTIIRNLHKDGDSWDGGDILDPANGQVYKVKLTPDDGGKKLTVRGYIGVPMLGRSQTWLRVE